MFNSSNKRSIIKTRKCILTIIIVLSFFLQMLGAPSVLVAAGEEFTISTYGLNPPGEVKKDEPFTLTVTILVNDETAVNNSYDVSLQDCSFYFSDKNTTSVPLKWVSGTTTGTVALPLKYDGGSRTEINLIISDSSGTPQTVIGNPVKLTIAPSENTPAPVVVNPTPIDTTKFMPVLQFTGSNTISGNAGETLGVYLTIKNTSSYTAKDIRIKPNLEENSPFVPNERNFAVLETLEPNKTATVYFSFDISPYAEEKIYPVKFDFEYYNNSNDFFGGSTAPRSDTLYIKVNNPNTAPHFSVIATSTLANLEGAPAEVINTQLKITNLGNLEARDVKVTLQGLKDDGMGLYQDSNLRNLGNIEGKGEAVINFALLPSSKMDKGNYGLVAKIDYKDQNGQSYSDEFHFFVEVTKAGSKSNQNTVPKLILNQYSSNPSIVKAGDNFTLNLSFLNTSSSKTISNIKVYFTVPEGGTNNSSGSVFSPVNTSNTIYIDSIPPKGVYHEVLEYYTIPDATPKTYTLTANFEYEDENGESYEAKELIGIPVSQQLKLETSELVVPSEVFTGEPVAISVDFYNTGKAKLSNLMFKIEGDFEIQNASYYVGNFDVGSSDYFEGTVIPNTPGIHEGALVITYEDTSGEIIEVRKPFTINAMEMPMPEMPSDFEQGGMTPEGSSKTIWWIGGGLLAVIILLLVLIKKGVFKKLIGRKKGLTLDE